MKSLKTRIARLELRATDQEPPQVILLTCQGTADEQITGIRLTQGGDELVREPGESLEELEQRAVALARGRGVSGVVLLRHVVALLR